MLKNIIEKSKARRKQDIWVISLLPITDGFYIDVCVKEANIIGRNTFGLNKIGWSGFCLKPEDSLLDNIKKYNVPKKIDYLSLNFQGKEYEQLSSFPFWKYKIQMMTVEYPIKKENNKMKVRELLEKNKFRLFSQHISEDWFVHHALWKKFNRPI